jgi:1,4-alpha-glucan branching enzyme
MGVFADGPGSPNSWVVVTEVPDPSFSQTTRGLVLTAAGGQQEYWFVTGRRFGAQKYTSPDAAKPGIHFAVWAPNAQNVEVVFAPFRPAPGTPTGYIAGFLSTLSELLHGLN